MVKARMQGVPAKVLEEGVLVASLCRMAALVLEEFLAETPQARLRMVGQEAPLEVVLLGLPPWVPAAAMAWRAKLQDLEKALVEVLDLAQVLTETPLIREVFLVLASWVVEAAATWVA